MTDSSLDQGLEAFAIPTEAIVLADQRPDAQPRTLVVAALRQELQRRRLALPLGPETDLDNPERLLLLNRVAVQIVTAGPGSPAPLAGGLSGPAAACGSTGG